VKKKKRIRDWEGWMGNRGLSDSSGSRRTLGTRVYTEMVDICKYKLFHYLTSRLRKA
jgi:hypothetical protein